MLLNIIRQQTKVFKMDNRKNKKNLTFKRRLHFPWITMLKHCKMSDNHGSKWKQRDGGQETCRTRLPRSQSRDTTYWWQNSSDALDPKMRTPAWQLSVRLGQSIFIRNWGQELASDVMLSQQSPLSVALSSFPFLENQNSAGQWWHIHL